MKSLITNMKLTPPIQHHAPLRRAFTLVEVCIAMSISAIILYGLGGLFSLFGRIDRANHEQARIANELNRLAEQFRDDVHAAESADEMRNEPNESNGAVLRLRMAGNNRIVYDQPAEHELLRTEYKDEKVIRREAFDLGPSVTFAVRPAEHQARLLSLAIERTADGASDGLRNRHVTAMIGRDRRTLKSQTRTDTQRP
jgi:prepilin-type N-terminal cleavage/methylation domain-containing protein